MTIKRMLGCLVCVCLIMGMCGGKAADASSNCYAGDASASAPVVWQSNTGKMQIYLKVPQMLRPDAEQFYLIDVTPRLFTKDEMLRVLQAFDPDAAKITGQYKEPYRNYMVLEMKNKELTLTASGDRDNKTWSNVRLQCAWNNAEYITGSMQILQRWHDGNAAHCQYTLEEARSLADGVAAAIAPDYAYSAWGLMVLIPRNGEDTGNDNYDYIEGYSFCYTPVMEGVHIPYTPDEDESEGLTLLPVRLPRLYVKIMDSGLYEVVWEGAQDVGAKTPVKALLPDAQILDIAQSILPLAHMDLEQSLGDAAALVVEKIQLSYCRVQRRDQPGQYVMTPVWDFFGYSAEKTQDGALRLHNINPNVSLLTLNAIDGTVIDQHYGY